MSNPIHAVQPPLEFIPPNFNPLIFQIVNGCLPTWLQFQTPIREIEATHLEILGDLYHQFAEGKVRFLMAFRHPSVHDPFCMGYLIWRLLPQLASKQGLILPAPLHFHPIYDRGIPLWAGTWLGWLYSQLGGTPIHRGKLDRVGLRSARNLFVSGQFPLAAAPEGATNGHNERVSPLEPGIAQLGFWCAEDLQKAGRTETVFIVPIGIQYYYLDSPWQPLEKLITELEIDSGLPAWASDPSVVNPVPELALEPRLAQLYQRLLRLGDHVLTKMEEFYTRFYHQTLPTPPESFGEMPVNEMIVYRLNGLLDVALQVAEDYFNLPAKGNFIDRCRRLEQAGWDYIYRDDLKDLNLLSPLERGLADRVAEEASLRMWHMRLVESFVAVTGQYIREKPTLDRFAETTLLLWDVIARIKGNNPFNRPELGPQRVEMTIGDPLSVSQRWQDYQQSRRGAISTLTQDLQTALEGMIKI